MKNTSRILLFLVMLLANPISVHAYQTNIVDDKVTLQDIVRHFNGESSLERDDEGIHYAEYIFDGANVTLVTDEGFLWINGQPRPYTTTDSEGVLLPKHYKVDKIWGESSVPVDFMVRELGYQVKGDKLVFDKPLGALDVDDGEGEEKSSDESLETTTTPSNNKNNKDNEEENNVQDNNQNSTTVESVPPINTEKSNNNADDSPSKEADKEKEDAKKEDTKKDNEIEVDSEKNTEDVNGVEEEVDDSDNNESVEEHTNTFSVLGELFAVGQHFSVKSSYTEKQQYIRDGNILSTWNSLRVNSNRPTLLVGRGDTVFGGIQGKLTIGTVIKVIDISNKAKEYSIVDKEKGSVKNTDKLHDSIYESYKNVNSVVLQFQEGEDMSFYIAT